jgi:two-component system response regulator AtoC
VVGSNHWAGVLANSEISASFFSTAEAVWDAVSRRAFDIVLIEAAQEAAYAALIEKVRQHLPELPVAVLRSSEREEALLCVRQTLLLQYEKTSHEPLSIEPMANLLGTSSVMDRVREMIARSATGMATVLVRGETGTGKELVAKALHQMSPRAQGPFVALHCAALPESLLESELFGYEKGAFTGAVARKIGRVEAASGGTLFLDEIGEITAATQAKLLRLIQEREYQRLGGVAPLRADVRFVAATHRDLEAMVKAGTFREDLFYRLNVVPLWVPPLRARGRDLELLAVQFCARFARENQRGNMSISLEALNLIRRMRWPGNVRQLQNFVERLVVLGSGELITEADVQRSVSDVSPFESLVAELSSISEHRPVEQVRPLDESMRAAEKEAISRALKAAEGNRAKASRLLGISRASLYNKLREHGLP